MDEGKSKTREINPKENASILSVIFFVFTFKTIRKGTRKDLQDDDVYEILNDFQSQKLGNRLEVEWKKEFKKSKPFFMGAVYRMFWLEYLVLGIIILIGETVFLILEPTFTGKVVSYFDPQANTTREEALMYAGALFSSSFLWRIFDNTYLFAILQMGMRIRIACCSLFYRKCLKLDLSNSPQTAGGTAVTLMNKDVVQFDVIPDFGHALIAGLIKMFVFTYLLYSQIGVSAIGGALLLYILIPLQGRHLFLKCAQYGGFSAFLNIFKGLLCLFVHRINFWKKKEATRGKIR